MIKKLDDTRENLLAVRISGKLEEADYQEIYTKVKPLVEKYDQPRLYFEIDDLEGVTPKAVYERIKDQKYFNKFHKVAIVGDKKWQEMMVDLFSSLMEPEGKFFETDKKSKALNWLRSN
jgi:hypothetical protein